MTNSVVYPEIMVCLIISDFEEDPHQITQLFSIEPDHIVVEGVVGQSGHAGRTNRWSVATRRSRRPLNEHISALLSALVPCQEQVRDLCQRSHVQLLCELSIDNDTNTFDMVIDREQIQQLSLINCSVGFDLYR